MGMKILLFSLLCLVSSTIIHFHQTGGFVAADQTLIQKTCRNTLYYKLCMTSLRSDPTSLNADTKGLAAIMAGVGVANATATSSYLSSQVLSATNDTDMKKLLKECSDKYAFASEALRASLHDLSAETYDYAYMHISAAADYPNVCHDAFKSYPGLAYPQKLERREEGLKHICRVVLGIVDLLGW